MTSCYFAQLFLLDDEQLNKMFKEQLKEKDNQLEIDFEKADSEAKQDEMFSKMNKKELIEYIKEKNADFEKYNKKHSELFEKYNQLLVKENKQYHTIQNLKGTISMLEESNGKLVNDYNFLQRLYNGTKEACIKWKNEAIKYQYKLQLFDDLF